MFTVVAMVCCTTFPPDNVVRLSLRIVEFYHEFELEFLLRSQGLNFLERDLSDPEMTVCPFHLHAATTTILIRIPAAEEVG